MRRLVIRTLFLLLLISVSASAFNGGRRGFVLGGGIGFGPVASISEDGRPYSKKENSGVAVNFMIGYAWDEQKMIVYFRDAVIYEAEFVVLGFGGDKNVVLNVAQGFSGVGYFHYFGEQGSSAFLTAGLGLQDYTFLDNDVASYETGFGFLIGGGYEFRPHVQVYMNLSGGKTSLGSVVDFNHTQLTVGVAAVAF